MSPKKYVRKFNKKSKAPKISAKRVLDIVHKGPSQGKIYKFTRYSRYFDGANYNIYSDTTDAFSVISFHLAQVPNYAEFTALYDQYCITKVDVHFYSCANSTITDGTNKHLTQVLSVIDYDDDSYLTSVDDALEYDTVQINSTAQYHFKRTLKPRVALEIYRSAIATAYGQGAAGTWLDCSDASVPHYGIKMVIPATVVPYNCRWSIYVKYHLEFRNVR